MATKVFKRDLLVQVAKEMNEIMQLTPPIDCDSMTEDETLQDVVMNNAIGGGNIKDAIRADDKFSEEVWTFFAESGVWDEKKKCPIISREAKEHHRMEKDESTGDEKEPATGKGKPAPEQPENKLAGKAKAPAAPAKGKAPASEEEKEDTMAHGAPNKRTLRDKKRQSRGTATQRNAATKKKEPKEQSRYGHRVGTGGARIDDLVYQGATIDKIASVMISEFKVKKGSAENKVRAHLAQLKRLGVKLTVSDKGKVETKTEKI